MLLSDGGSVSGTSWVSGALDAAQAVSAQADMATEFASFTKFRTRVDELIRDLKGSQAGPAKIGQEQLIRHQLGGGDGAWSDAAGMFTAYETVISDLEKLSKLLSDSMEGMGIAVLASHKGYENIDLDVRDRMAAITAETTEHYGGQYDPGLPQQSLGSGDGQASVGGDAGGSI
ncbi:hypothetical protein ABZZ80_01965 [Streptomyces sp. NPDC006356]